MTNDRQSPALVVLAAGLGSRFGGLKQLTPVGPNGELLLEYSVSDALAAGCGRVVFVIKPEMEAAFRETVGARIGTRVPVDYVFQTLSDLPGARRPAPGRQKPYGTGHAVYCCRRTVREPFIVINADDYYGAESYRLLTSFLKHPAPGTAPVAMVGFRLENTLTENGTVSRGICEVDATGRLLSLTERTRIERRENGIGFWDEGGAFSPLSPDSLASMNCWAFPEGLIDRLEPLLAAFLDAPSTDPLRGEFYLPAAVDALVAAGEASVRVLHTTARWYGMTYAADQAALAAALRQLPRPFSDGADGNKNRRAFP